MSTEETPVTEPLSPPESYPVTDRSLAAIRWRATYYKATALSGLDFHTGTIDYAAALASGEVIRHPARKVRDAASTCLSVSVEPADCTGFSWPCRLFRVEPVGRAIKAGDYPNKRCVSALRVVEELPAHLALGPNGEAVARLIEAAGSLTPEQAQRLAAAWDALEVAAWYAAWAAAGAAASAADAGAAWDAAGAAARAAAALLVRDRISPEHYDTLTRPWREAIGPELVA